MYEVRSLDFSMLTHHVRGDSVRFEDVSHAVKWCKGLQRINLDLKLNSRAGIEHLGAVLQECTALRELNLANNGYINSDAQLVATALAGAPITSLDLRYNMIGGNGAEELSKFLDTCSTLSELHLTKNWLGEQGVRSLARGLQTSSTTLTTVNLQRVNMQDDGATAFARILLKLVVVEHIDISSNDIREQGMTALAHGLASAKHLRVLNISDNKVGPAVAKLDEVLRACPELSDLCMNSIELTDAGAASMEAAWGGHEQLTCLRMRANELCAHGLASIARLLLRYGRLRDLDLSNNHSHEEHGWRSLCDCFAQLTALQRLALEECGLRQSTMLSIASGVIDFKALRCLRLDGNHMCAPSTAALGLALKHCTTLVELGLLRAELGPLGMRELAPNLALCTSLERLHLAKNDICNSGVQPLAYVLGKCKRLRELDISRNKLDKMAVRPLFGDQCNYTALEKLNVSDNKFGAEGTQTLMRLLAQCSSLSWLDLSMCDISCGGAEALAAGLPLCTRLRTLDLSWNAIMPAGAVKLANALSLCLSLTRLCVTGNQIQREGCWAMVQHAHEQLCIEF